MSRNARIVRRGFLELTSPESEQRAFWRLAASCTGALLFLNWSWYAWAREIPGSLSLYVVLGSLVYFVLLRWATGIGFFDLSPDARFVVASSTLLLIVFLAFGRSNVYYGFWERFVPVDARTPLLGFLYFAACSVVLRLLIPYCLLRFKLRHPPRDYGYVVRGGTRWRWVYLALFVLTVPWVLWAATRPDFQASYPQTRGIVVGGQVSLGLFALYHAAYFMMFLSGESFWRGYMTFGLGRDLGLLALPWMVMLYSIGHYAKPLLEVNGSIVAGYVLGYLALRHHSFFLGAVLHWSIALTMDLSVLWHRAITWQ